MRRRRICNTPPVVPVPGAQCRGKHTARLTGPSARASVRRVLRPHSTTPGRAYFPARQALSTVTEADDTAAVRVCCSAPSAAKSCSLERGGASPGRTSGPAPRAAQRAPGVQPGAQPAPAGLPSPRPSQGSGASSGAESRGPACSRPAAPATRPGRSCKVSAGLSPGAALPPCGLGRSSGRALFRESGKERGPLAGRRPAMVSRVQSTGEPEQDVGHTSRGFPRRGNPSACPQLCRSPARAMRFFARGRRKPAGGDGRAAGAARWGGACCKSSDRS